MTGDRLDGLYSPFRIGSLTLANRFVMPAMQRELAPDGVPSAEMARHYRARVEGGVGLVIGEATAVNHPAATHYWKYAMLTPPAVEGWKPVIEAVKAAGGRIFLQLWHQGAVREEGKGPYPLAPTIGPSGLLGPGQPSGRPMTAGDMEEVTAAFVEGARTAKALGADGVEIHCAHGYLLDQFLWHETNRREDGYGGDHIARTRYPCEVISAIRSEVGAQFPVSARISQWKERDYSAKIANTPQQLEDILLALKGAGVDIFHASTRRFWETEFPGSSLGFAGWVKRLSGLPVITVGSVGLDSDIMASLVGTEARSTGGAGLAELARRFNNGEFDLVAVGRAILGDAQWVKKVKEGRYDELKPFTRNDLSFLTDEDLSFLETHGASE